MINIDFFPYLTRPDCNGKDIFEVCYAEIKTTTTLTVRNWIDKGDQQTLALQSLDGYGIKKDTYYKSCDSVKRRLIVVSTQFGNLALYEQYADMEGQGIRVIAPDEVLSYLGLRETSFAGASEAALLLSTGFDKGGWKKSISSVSQAIFPSPTN